MDLHAIDADSKVCVSWLVGPRDGGTATEFMQQVAGRLADRVQLSTHGHVMYLDAVKDAFGGSVDHAIMRRFTRVTNTFSKKLANHLAAVALHFMHYSFRRLHQTLHVTPAMAAGVSDHVWEIGELAPLLGQR